MARRRTRRSVSRKTKVIKIGKRNVGIPVLIVCFLYIFTYFFAPETPIAVLLGKVWDMIYGQKWTIYIAFLWLLYFLAIYKKSYLIKSISNRFFLLSVSISSIINFPVVENINTDYVNYGGYISSWLIEILRLMFWDNIAAIKLLCLLCLIAGIIWIIFVLNIELPRVTVPKIQIQAKDKQELSSRWWYKDNLNNSDNSNKVKISKDAYVNISEKNNTWLWQINKDEDIKSKLKQAISAKLGLSKWSYNKVWTFDEYFDQGGNTSSIENNINYKKPVFPADKPTFGIQLLDQSDSKSQEIDHVFIQEKWNLIQKKFAEFGVWVDIAWYDIWPSVVQIKVQPHNGVKLSDIEKLKNDLMLWLRAKTLRIIAPIPGTHFVWIEIPNPKATMVRLSDILSSDEFMSKVQDNLTNLALGKWVDGKISVKSLESMPHLLIAWATWQGKSVWVNDFILSLIYQNTPDELKFIMIDPKQVEMELYSWLPYLLCPIVTDPEKALKALKRATVEMDNRYSLLKQYRVKNISEYNEAISSNKNNDSNTSKMNRIVVVIDELADLMMSGKKKDVELCITRIAQKARAVGMHLIVATQRPSVNVITWLIKANMPTRISFGVVSNVDSRTILDMKWAEDLLGKWDMLYLDPSSKHPLRLQCPYVDTKEIEKVVTKLKEKYMRGLEEEEIYDQELVALLESNISTWSNWHILFDGENDGSDEALMEQAIDLIRSSRKASTTAIQRKLKIWFARAGRIMDMLEERGIVWPQEWWKPRDVLI